MNSAEGIPNDDKGKTRPRDGAYYWIPRPVGTDVSWDLMTSEDAGLNADMGHVTLWLPVLDRLARIWGKSAKELRQSLSDGYTGLPRGRVCRVKSRFLVAHGADAPIESWQMCVMRRFQLTERRSRFIFDEHERMIEGDPEAVQEALGRDLGLRGIVRADEPLGDCVLPSFGLLNLTLAGLPAKPYSSP